MSIFLKINKPIENITETYTIIYTHIICILYILYIVHHWLQYSVFWSLHRLCTTLKAEIKYFNTIKCNFYIYYLVLNVNGT